MGASRGGLRGGLSNAGLVAYPRSGSQHHRQLLRRRARRPAVRRVRRHRRGAPPGVLRLAGAGALVHPRSATRRAPFPTPRSLRRARSRIRKGVRVINHLTGLAHGPVRLSKDVDTVVNTEKAIYKGTAWSDPTDELSTLGTSEECLPLTSRILLVS